MIGADGVAPSSRADTLVVAVDTVVLLIDRVVVFPCADCNLGWNGWRHSLAETGHEGGDRSYCQGCMIA